MTLHLYHEDAIFLVLRPSAQYLEVSIRTPDSSPSFSYRFPRVFGDEFGDEFGDSLNFVSKLVTHLVMISVNHCIW